MERELVSKYLGVNAKESDVKSVEYEKDGTISQISMKGDAYVFNIVNDREKVIKLCKEVLANCDENNMFNTKDYEVLIKYDDNTAVYISYDSESKVGEFVDSINWTGIEAIIIDDFSNEDIVTSYIYGNGVIAKGVIDDDTTIYVATTLINPSSTGKSKEEIDNAIADSKALAKKNKNIIKD